MSLGRTCSKCCGVFAITSSFINLTVTYQLFILEPRSPLSVSWKWRISCNISTDWHCWSFSGKKVLVPGYPSLMKFVKLFFVPCKLVSWQMQVPKRHADDIYRGYRLSSSRLCLRVSQRGWSWSRYSWIWCSSWRHFHHWQGTIYMISTYASIQDTKRCVIVVEHPSSPWICQGCLQSFPCCSWCQLLG